MQKYYKIYTFVLAAIIIELFSPIPLFLSFGALYVVFMKPKWFLRFIQQMYNLKQTEENERLIIESAREHNNRLTVTELAASTCFNLDEAEYWLQKLEINGRISSNVNDRGIIVYNFEELLPSQ